jgi:hypothetical protein
MLKRSLSKAIGFNPPVFTPFWGFLGLHNKCNVDLHTESRWYSHFMLALGIFYDKYQWVLELDSTGDTSFLG